MTRVFDLETRIRRNPNVVWRSFSGELAVLDPAIGRLSTLNEVAARCWELADGRSFAAMLEVLMNEFDVERTELEADVGRLLTGLAERGLLID